MLRGLTASLAALLCGSCSRSFEIVPVGFGPNVQLSFVEGGFLNRKARAACIAELTVREEAWPNRRPQGSVWQIKAKQGCVTITGVDVGHTPIGFVETVNRLPLTVRRMFGAHAEARPYGGASMPWFVCRKSPAIVEWRNEQRLESPPADCAS